VWRRRQSAHDSAELAHRFAAGLAAVTAEHVTDHPHHDVAHHHDRDHHDPDHHDPDHHHDAADNHDATDNHDAASDHHRHHSDRHDDCSLHDVWLDSATWDGYDDGLGKRHLVGMADRRRDHWRDPVATRRVVAGSARRLSRQLEGAGAPG
jgi:hypothetical protein